MTGNIYDKDQDTRIKYAMKDGKIHGLMRVYEHIEYSVHQYDYVADKHLIVNENEPNIRHGEKLIKKVEYNNGELTGNFKIYKFKNYIDQTLKFRNIKAFNDHKFPLKAISKLDEKTGKVRVLLYWNNGKLKSKKFLDKKDLLKPEVEDSFGFGEYIYKNGMRCVLANLVK